MAGSVVDKLKGLLLVRPAISSRNLTSLALVVLFFGVYIASGGKIDYVPDVEPGSSFGSVKGYPSQRTPQKKPPPAAVQRPPQSRQEVRQPAPPPARRSYDTRTYENEEYERSNYEEAPRRSTGGLSDIERRLRKVR